MKDKKLIHSNSYFLTLKHYKEPLREIKNGFGFYGAILGTKDDSSTQCHICGELFSDLASHARQAHKIGNLEYKEKFQLARTSALISEAVRIQRKQSFLDYLKSLSEEEKEEYLAKSRLRQKRATKNSKIRGRLISLETKNKRGTCPDQLLDQIRKVHDEIGHTPSKHEFIGETGTQRFVHLIYKTFGSWSNAIKLCGLKPSGNNFRPKSTRRWEDDELLEMLRIFAQENNKIPTATDFRRGLLPDYAIYIRRWGTIEKARLAANVYQFIDPENQ